MNDFANRIANLSPEARALFEAKLRWKATARRWTIPALPRSGQRESFPVSFAEQRLWFLDQWEPKSPLYNISTASMIEGLLDVKLLERCVNEIIKRHESLRTTFATEAEQPVQVIHPNVELTLSVTDLSTSYEDEREAKAYKLALEEAQTPFDLSSGPLIRAKLLRLSGKKHALLTTIHHIVSDGWSIGVFFKELSELYSAHDQGTPAALPELPIQYADYAVWQRQWLQGEVLDKQTAYWEKQLAALPPLLELPTDRPRPALQSFNGARETRIMPRHLLDALKTVGQSEGTTLYMTLLAVFQVLLARYARSDDIAVGSPIAGRTRAETEN
ncbi:MAG: condensation domain-containing protein, partial [Burkholderiales bacterium]